MGGLCCAGLSRHSILYAYYTIFDCWQVYPVASLEGLMLKRLWKKSSKLLASRLHSIEPCLKLDAHP